MEIGSSFVYVNGVLSQVTLSSTHLLWNPCKTEAPGSSTEEAVGLHEILGVTSRAKPGPQWPEAGGLCGGTAIFAGAATGAAAGTRAVVHAIWKPSDRPHLWHPCAIELMSQDTQAMDTLCQRIEQGVLRSAGQRPSNVLVLVNPVAGSGQGPALLRSVVLPTLRCAGVATAVRFTRYPGHTERIIQSQDLSQFDGVVAMGGDGAFHEVVNALYRCCSHALGTLRLAHIPTGSTDAVACSLTGSRSVFGACARIALGCTGRLDVLCVQPAGHAASRACCIAAAGFMGDVCAAAEAWRVLGPLRYDLLGAKALLLGPAVDASIRFRNATLTEMARRVLGAAAEDAPCLAGCGVCGLAQRLGHGGHSEVPGHETEDAALPMWQTLSGRWRSIMLIVTPCRSDKTPAGMARTGHLADGRLKLVLVPDVGPLGLLRVLESMARRGLAAGDPGPVEVHDAEEVIVTAGATAPLAGLDWNVDGEPVRARSLHARMERAALSVFSNGIEAKLH